MVRTNATCGFVSDEHLVKQYRHSSFPGTPVTSKKVVMYLGHILKESTYINE